MKKQITDLVFILDKSGSMGVLEKHTIDGFNNMLNKQKELEDDCFITTVLFNDKIEVLHDNVDIKKVKKINSSNYQVEGTTALLDAMGITINNCIKRQKENKSDKVLFVIITDGEENSSSEFTVKKVKNLIDRQTEKFKWEFIFLGANIDSIKTAKSYGITVGNISNFINDSEGVKLNFETVGAALKGYRTNDSIDKDWNKSIDENFKKRKGK